MKNLYGKSKGKIHPDGVGGGGGALQAALAILPAAILALAAALSPEDREVLAYLVARSLRGAAPVDEPQPQPMRWRSSKGKGNAGGAQHHHSHHHHQQQQQPRHGFECGCFDCYRGFWCRWDASPDREVIHQAIEAFEEHLASGEMEIKASKGGRRRAARGKNKGKSGKGTATVDEKVGKGTTADECTADEKLSTEYHSQHHAPMNTDEATPPVFTFPASSALDATDSAIHSAPPPTEPATDVVPTQQIQQQPEEEDHEEEEYYDDWKQQTQPTVVEHSNNTSSCSLAAADYSMRRRGGGWADVMGLFNSRLWSLWSPGA